MIQTVTGLVEIVKTEAESSEDYKVKVANLLYGLQASYGGISREIYANLPDWHPEKRSKLEEEPCELNEDEILADFETKDAFIEHHSEHGWNKTFDLNVLDKPLQETMYGSFADADEGDFIHWVRKTNTGEVKYFNVYLLKYVDHLWMSDEGISSLNGVMFAEKYSDQVYDKIKRVLTKFTCSLNVQDLFKAARIEKPGLAEVLQYSGNNAEWTRVKK